MRTAIRQAWMHVKYTRKDLRSNRERIEEKNAWVRKREERGCPGMGTIVDPTLAVPNYTRFQDGPYGLKFRYIISLAILVIISIIVILGLGIRSLTHNIDHRECPRKAVALGIEARWVDYSFFDWECLANINGRWVPIDTVHNDTGIWIRPNTGQ